MASSYSYNTKMMFCGDIGHLHACIRGLQIQQYKLDIKRIKSLKLEYERKINNFANQYFEGSRELAKKFLAPYLNCVDQFIVENQSVTKFLLLEQYILDAIFGDMYKRPDAVANYKGKNSVFEYRFTGNLTGFLKSKGVDEKFEQGYKYAVLLNKNYSYDIKQVVVVAFSLSKFELLTKSMDDLNKQFPHIAI